MTSSSPPNAFHRDLSILPSAFIERIRDGFPDKADDIFTSYFQTRGIGLRLNPLKAVAPENQREWNALLSQTQIVDPGWSWMRFLPAAQFDARAWEPFFQAGVVIQQSLSSQIVSVALVPKEGERILDLCAAPGGKTAHIAALMNNTGSITAVDVSRPRLYRMSALMRRLGVVNTRWVCCDGRAFKDQHLFDRVLVDAPCSCEARFMVSKPETFHYWNMRKVYECAHKQKGLLKAAVRLVRPGGCVVYATCTLSWEENEEVVASVLKEYGDDLALEPLSFQGIPRLPSPSFVLKDPIGASVAQACLRIFPDQRWEPFFIVRLRRLKA